MEEAAGDAQGRAQPEAEHHVADLAHGGEGEEALEVALRQHEERSAEERGRADPGDDGAPGRRPGGDGTTNRLQ